MVSLSFGFPWGADRHSHSVVEALVQASAVAGAAVDVTAEGSWPAGNGVAVVLAPPEAVAWTAPAAAAQSMLLCLARPGTSSYEGGVAAGFATHVTTDRYTARRLRWLGRAVVELPLGPWRGWALPP